MEINDEVLLSQIIEFCDTYDFEEEAIKSYGGKIINKQCNDHPLDSEVRQEVKKLLETIKSNSGDTTKEISYQQSKAIDSLWLMLVDKSIKCLRFFDKREPFQKMPSKHPLVYGIDELEKYHSKYGDFEGLLYGSDSYYRDHVFHVVRCWMLGIYCLLTKNTTIIKENRELIQEMHIEGEKFEVPKSMNYNEAKGLYKLTEEDDKKLENGDAIVRKVKVEEEKEEEKLFELLTTIKSEVNGKERILDYKEVTSSDIIIKEEIEKLKNGNEVTKVLKKDEIERLIKREVIEKFFDEDEYEGKDEIKIKFELIQGVKISDCGFSKDINMLEKLSMWTIISLCHDLGYPLEKSQKILNKTRDMMAVFIAQPKIWSDLNFNGVQDSINEYIIKFMSTKMKTKEENDKYNGRIQPKYYLKYTKSLEKNSHGIISSIIVYKMLLYFIEADANLNDDYVFEKEDARQFYIRREILRAMASHTCEDVYQMEATTFISLLFLCDELQEWGRKSWKNMYNELPHNAISLEVNKFNSSIIDTTEIVNMESTSVDQIIYNINKIFERQYILYKTTFRDGQDTAKRKFDICKKMEININKKTFKSIKKIVVKYSIMHDREDAFNITIEKSGDSPDRNGKDKELLNKIAEKIQNAKKKYKYDNIEFQK